MTCVSTQLGAAGGTANAGRTGALAAGAVGLQLTRNEHLQHALLRAALRRVLPGPRFPLRGSTAPALTTANACLSSQLLRLAEQRGCLLPPRGQGWAQLGAGGTRTLCGALSLPGRFPAGVPCPRSMPTATGAHTRSLTTFPAPPCAGSPQALSSLRSASVFFFLFSTFFFQGEQLKDLPGDSLSGAAPIPGLSLPWARCSAQQS